MKDSSYQQLIRALQTLPSSSDTQDEMWGTLIHSFASVADEIKAWGELMARMASPPSQLVLEIAERLDELWDTIRVIDILLKQSRLASRRRLQMELNDAKAAWSASDRAKLASYVQWLRQKRPNAIETKSRLSDRLQVGEALITFAQELSAAVTYANKGAEVAQPATKSTPTSEPATSANSAKPTQSKLNYDVALSYAGEDRAFVEQVAAAIQAGGATVFYDTYEQADLWGKDLYVHLDEIYRLTSSYCIIFISAHYARKLWTSHELRSAQARAFTERREYILPVRLDDTSLPGVRDTVGYLDGRALGAHAVAQLALAKLGKASPQVTPPPAARSQRTDAPAGVSVSPSPTSQPPAASSKALKREAFQARIKALSEEYKALSADIDSALGADDRLRLQRRADQKLSEIRSAEEELRSLNESGAS